MTALQFTALYGKIKVVRAYQTIQLYRMVHFSLNEPDSTSRWTPSKSLHDLLSAHKKGTIFNDPFWCFFLLIIMIFALIPAKPIAAQLEKDL